MDNNNEVKLTKEQEDALRETLERGVAFEEMITSRGWQYLMAYYQNQIASFMNDMMKSDIPLAELEERRRELMGIKKLMAQVDSAVRTWKAHVKEENVKPA